MLLKRAGNIDPQYGGRLAAADFKIASRQTAAVDVPLTVLGEKVVSQRGGYRGQVLIDLQDYGAIGVPLSTARPPAPQDFPDYAASLQLARLPKLSGSLSTAGLRGCDPNISVNRHTSCPFAENVFRAYARDYQANGQQSDNTVNAYSPVTRRSYEMECKANGAIVTCTGSDDEVITFPMYAVQVY